MISKQRIDAALRPAGLLLVVASAVFLIVVARRQWAAMSEIAVSPRQWLAVAGLSLVYGLSLFLLAGAWHLILKCAGAQPPGLRHSVMAYTTAQLAKYVPGNVFHLLGRHMIHRAAGMDDKRLAMAVLAELLLMLAAAATVAALGVLLDPPEFVRSLFGPLLVAVALMVLGLLHGARRMAGAATACLLAAFAACLAFFAVMGGIIATLASLLGGPLSWSTGGSGVAAWIAGFVTPGAPGGLGVREAAMILLGGKGANAEILLVTAALFRLVTFAGDVLCFLLGRALLRASPDQA